MTFPTWGEERATDPVLGDGNRHGHGATGDPVGDASARLLAAGVERRERLATLEFFGLLLDHATADGRVRLDPAMLAGEFDVDPGAATSHMARLASVGSIRRDGAGWVIPSYRDYRPSGLRAADAMALIAEALGRPPADAPVAAGELARRRSVEEHPAGKGPAEHPLVEEPATMVLEPTPGRAADRAERRWGRAPAVAAALAAAAAVFAAVVLVPLRDDTRLAQTAAGTATQPGTDGADVVSGSDPAQSPSGAPGGDGVARTEPGASQPSTPTSADGGATVTGSAGAAPPVTCPGRPAVTVVDTDVVPLAEAVTGQTLSQPALPRWSVVVDGNVVNDAEIAGTVTSILVRAEVDGEVMEAEAVQDPITLEGDGEAFWRVSFRAGTTPPQVGEVTATLAGWSWSDEAVAGACGG